MIELDKSWLEANIELKDEAMGTIKSLFEIAFGSTKYTDSEIEWIRNDTFDVVKQLERVQKQEKKLLEKYFVKGEK